MPTDSVKKHSLSFTLTSRVRKKNVKIENFIWRFIWRRVCFASNPLQFILNDLLATLKMVELYNFADDITISTASKIMNNLIHTLEKESEATAE